MSSIYNNLSKINLRADAAKPGAEDSTGRFRGIRLAIAGAFLLSLSSLTGAFFLSQSVRTEKQARLEMETQQAQIQDKAGMLESQAAQYRTEILRMKDQLKAYETERKGIQDEMERSRGEIADLRKKIKEWDERSRKTEQGIPAADLRQAAAVRVAVRQETADARDLPQASSPKPSADKIPMKTLAVKTASFAGKESQEPVKTEPVRTAEPAQEAAGKKAADTPAGAGDKFAKVLTVNRKFNFVVINIGMRDRVQLGERLTIERNGKRIAGVEIEKLYDNFAAATIVEESKNARIEEGDWVKPV